MDNLEKLQNDLPRVKNNLESTISKNPELLSKVKKVFLQKNCWVPLKWEMTEGIVDILIDDPKNLEKTDSPPKFNKLYSIM